MPTATRRGVIDPLAGLVSKIKKITLSTKRKRMIDSDDLANMFGKMTIGTTTKTKSRKRKNRFSVRKTNKRKTPKPTGNEMDLTGGKRRRSRRGTKRR
jgi:hypothetical protein